MKGDISTKRIGKRFARRFAATAVAVAVAIVICVSVLFYKMTGPTGDPDWFLIAHAANAPGLPENSIKGIIRNIELGADGIEVDVTITKDGELILMRGKALNRTTDCTGRAIDHTSEEIVSKCRLTNGDVVPLLRDALRYLMNDYRGLVFIELKFFGRDYSDRERNVSEVLSLLSGYETEKERVIITSFDFVLLDMLRHRDDIVVAGEGSYRWSIPRRTNNLLRITGQTPGSFRLRLGDLFGIDAYIYTIRKPSDITDVVVDLLRHKSVKGVMVDDVATLQGKIK
jgi:glycerophosphoryl diester phosphodiesterase